MGPLVGPCGGGPSRWSLGAPVCVTRRGSAGCSLLEGFPWKGFPGGGPMEGPCGWGPLYGVPLWESPEEGPVGSPYEGVP
jgi:hypothetical protein